MARLKLAEADLIISGALEHAAEIKAKPLAVAVLDDGGHLKAFKKQDGCSLFREDIARGKAYGALGFLTDSRALAQLAAERPAFFQSVFAASKGQVIPVAGGVLIRNDAGEVLGAVGASGDVSDKDEECVISGLLAAGFTLSNAK